MTAAEYRDLAERERAAAAMTTLVQVRDRHLRAAEAWDGMAEHMARTEEVRQSSKLAAAPGKSPFIWSR